MISTKVPTLMYHDVVDSKDNVRRIGIPSFYCIEKKLFRNQLRAMLASGFRSVRYDKVAEVRERDRAVVVTFDDGWKGNIRHAYPVLEENGVGALFFVTVSAIGSDDYMDWADLRRLVRSGMSVQSHGMTHMPMEELSKEKLDVELRESKLRLEDALSIPVDAISFPHGSYDSAVLKYAADAGYQYFFTSDVHPAYKVDYSDHTRTIARIAITSKLSSTLLMKKIEYSGLTYWKDVLRFQLRKIMRKSLGVNSYRSLYRIVYRIKPRAMGSSWPTR